MIIEIRMDVPGLSDRLKQARHKSRLTQKTVATKVGVTPKTINHLETDLRGVTFTLLNKLCELYGVSVGEIANLPEIDELSGLQ